MLSSKRQFQFAVLVSILAQNRRTDPIALRVNPFPGEFEMKTKLTVAAIVCAAMCLLSTLVQAQSFTGSIVGTVKNASGEVIAGAQITITQVQTNKQFSAVTNGEGYFTSPPLPVGEYRIEARMTGFRRA